MARPAISPVAQRLTRLVDLLELVPLRHHQVQRELPLLEPADKHGEVPVRDTAPARRAPVDVAPEEVEGGNVRRLTVRNADQHCRTALALPEPPRPRHEQSLLNGHPEADGVEGKVGAAPGQGGHLRHGVALGGEDAMGRAELPREGELLRRQVDGNDGVRAGVGAPLNDAQADAASADDGAGRVWPHHRRVDSRAAARHHRAADD